MKLRTYICQECGAEYQGKQAKRSKLCESCALKKQILVAKQLHKHQGPYYEKWRERMIAALGG